jgi:hypothetical protein
MFWKKKKPTYITTADGNINLVWNGQTHSLGLTHPNYGPIASILSNKSGYDRLDDLLNPATTIERELNGITVNPYGEVFWNGEQINNVLADRIGEFMRNGEDYAPLALFLEKLMANPSGRAVNELYRFLEHGNFPVTEDGCFIAYKGISAEWKDKHTGRFDNSVGVINEMPRNKVNDDHSVGCSYGFHVGTHRYATDWAGSDGRVVLVKVNPADAVSVPLDCSCSKLRVCKYEVVEECEKLIEEPVYRSEVSIGESMPCVLGQDDDDYDCDSEDYCEHCGDYWCEGECQDD